MIQETSKIAYKAIKPELGTRQCEVLEQFIDDSVRFTNCELATKLGWSINRVTPRVFELREMGELMECGKRKCNITGRSAIVWGLYKRPAQGELF